MSLTDEKQIIQTLKKKEITVNNLHNFSENINKASNIEKYYNYQYIPRSMNLEQLTSFYVTYLNLIFGYTYLKIITYLILDVLLLVSSNNTYHIPTPRKNWQKIKCILFQNYVNFKFAAN